ncbi:MAG: hypothetical protein CM1200mP2_22570 [Planctomycetaceae bacterium]|nr:MAG: hypothetical protein CM1200mP2_22570 [Planctomycetaceae bacterium]
MSETGLVAAFTGVRRPFALMEFPVPEAEPGAAVVRITLANVCGSDLHIWRGTYDVSRGNSEPFCLSIGHEMTGVVHELGDGFTADSAGEPLAVGDRVVFQYFVGCGECRSCRRDTTPRCPEGLKYRFPPDQYPHFTAAYGQYYYLRPGQAVFKVPDNVPDELAGPANCALAQVIDGLERGGAGPEDRLVIQGAGGLGLNAIAVARERGVGQVIVVDGIPSRLELALAFGADHVIDLNEFPSAEDRIRRVFELTEGDGADLVMELVGSPRSFPRRSGCWPRAGRCWRSATSTGGRRHVGSLATGSRRQDDHRHDVVPPREPAVGIAAALGIGRQLPLRPGSLPQLSADGDRPGLCRPGHRVGSAGGTAAVGRWL